MDPNGMKAGNHTALAMASEFPYEPTPGQQELIRLLSDFLTGNESRGIFLLKGYAGTGKTTIISSLVRTLRRQEREGVLLAPTGRAAKVMAAYTGERAHTIHRHIYRLRVQADGTQRLVLQPNRYRHTLFIVDEASMVGGTETAPASGGLFGNVSLLDDLVQYVYGGRGCRLVLVGDTAQLPPVSAPEIPSLDASYMERAYGLQAVQYELKEVVRQARESGILLNATRLREMIARGQAGFPSFITEGLPDFARLGGEDTGDAINDAFSGREPDEALVVCRSNKRARLYNQGIRNRVLFREEEIGGGDLLMVVRNNYFWLPEDSPAGFLANGDILEVTRIRRHESLYGFRFADLTVRLCDYPEEPELDVKVVLDILHHDGPSLPSQEQNRLFQAVSEDYQDVAGRQARLARVRANPHFNALQVKFAYALTCHKAQGGQWEKVFVDMGYLPPGEPDADYLRWLYTAITRATKKVYLMNFHDAFFGQ